MKKIIVVLLVLFIIGGIAAADGIDRPYRDEQFTQDARIMAMGGYTAVANDINALFYNPAGLAFLPKSDFMLGNTIYGDFFGDVLDTGYLYDSDYYDDKDYGKMAFRGLSIISRAGFADRNWGVAAISDIGIVPNVIGEDEHDLTVEYDLSHRIGLIGGVGFNMGPFAVGANLRLLQSIALEKEVVTHDADLDYGQLADDLVDKLFDFSKADPRMEVGVGAMATLGSLTAGAYIDNFLALLGDDEQEHIFDKAWETASVGLAFTPFENKLFPSRDSILNLIIAGELNYIGDDVNRSMSIGSEVGLHLGKAVRFNLRGGYRQPMPGELSGIEFDFDTGEVFMGFGAKLLVLDLNIAASFPSLFLQDMQEDEEGYILFGEHDPRFSISAGIRL